MCLAFLGWNVHPEYAAVLLFNRDEFLSRPSEEPDWWPDSGVFGPRDPVGKGTWIGVSSHTGNFAFLTNFREPDGHLPRPISRGAVVSNFLVEDVSPEEYVEQLRETDSQTGGYNVVVGNLHTGSLWAHSNRGNQDSVKLGNGLHAMSNGRLSDIWPKMRKGLEQLEPMLTSPKPQTDERELWQDLFEVMKDQQRCPIEQVQVTGLSTDVEHMMSSMFIDEITIREQLYGTKSQTVMLATHDGDIMWHERTRVELVTDGENWETAHYVVFLEDLEEDSDDDEDEQTKDMHPEL